jgi:hypothetical protein
MTGSYLAPSAKTFIWAFFLLICVPVIQTAALKYTVPIRPILFYGVIAAGLFVSATLYPHSLENIKPAKSYFLIYAALVVLGAVMYRGEGFGPDFGQKILPPFQVPSSIGYALWPVLNLFAGAGLYLLACREEYRRTIITAAFASLVVQTAAMEADMWWPAIFGDANGRAGGFAQNANEAALLATTLASLTLPSVLGERFNRFAIYAVMLAAAGVFFSQSKSGFIVLFVLVLCFVAAKRKTAFHRPNPVFIAGYVGVILVTLFLSPVLNVTEEQIKQRDATRLTDEQVQQRDAIRPSDKQIQQRDGNNKDIGDPNAGGIVTMQERLHSRTSINSSINLRWEALAFYLGVVKENPFGMGTGYTNRFATGPHNSWLKLAVDDGIVAPILLVALLVIVTWQGIASRSPMLFSVAAIAWVSSALYHTIIIEPLIPVALGIAIGMSMDRRTGGPARPDSVRVP